MTIKEICKLDKNTLKSTLETELRNMGYDPINEDGFLYAEGTYPVMLIAHMDTVHHDNCTIICESPDGNYLMSPQGIGGDDRCGIFMVLETIKEIHCSVVFTEDEEIGCVGAQKFATSGYRPANLNYIIEYDRKGKNDAVFYSCDNPEFTEFVTDETIGFVKEHGSCSDISQIAPALGVAAVNISSGYYNQHTIGEYINIKQMLNNIERGKQLILKQVDKPFEYIEAKPYYSKYPTYSYNSCYDKYSNNRSNIQSGTSKSYYDLLYDYDFDDEKEDSLLGYSYNYGLNNDNLNKYAPDLPELPGEVEDYIKSGKGMILTPGLNYILLDGERREIKSLDEYLIDEAGGVYYYYYELGYYYPLKDEVKAYNIADDTPVIFDEMDSEEFQWGYYAKLIELKDYIDELDLYDTENGTQFLDEFYEILYSCC